MRDISYLSDIRLRAEVVFCRWRNSYKVQEIQITRLLDLLHRARDRRISLDEFTEEVGRLPLDQVCVLVEIMEAEQDLAGSKSLSTAQHVIS